MDTESSNHQCANEQLPIPQLPEFSDTQWFDAAMQAIQSPLLLYVVRLIFMIYTLCPQTTSHFIICCNFDMPASKRTKFGT